VYSVGYRVWGGVTEGPQDVVGCGPVLQNEVGARGGYLKVGFEFILVHSSTLGDKRLWVGPILEHLLSS
jgi:hypothetical protein